VILSNESFLSVEQNTFINVHSYMSEFGSKILTLIGDSQSQYITLPHICATLDNHKKNVPKAAPSSCRLGTKSRTHINIKYFLNNSFLRQHSQLYVRTLAQMAQNSETPLRILNPSILHFLTFCKNRESHKNCTQNKKTITNIENRQFLNELSV
jgi:hypothetical protein